MATIKAEGREEDRIGKERISAAVPVTDSPSRLSAFPLPRAIRGEKYATLRLLTHLCLRLQARREEGGEADSFSPAFAIPG